MHFHCSSAKLNEGYVAWHSIFPMLYFKQYASAKAFELIFFGGIQMSAAEIVSTFSKQETGLEMERQLSRDPTDLPKHCLRLVLVAVEIQLAKCSIFFCQKRELQHNFVFFSSKSSNHKYPLTSRLAIVDDIFLSNFPNRMGKSLWGRVNQVCNNGTDLLVWPCPAMTLTAHDCYTR